MLVDRLRRRGVERVPDRLDLPSGDATVLVDVVDDGLRVCLGVAGGNAVGSRGLVHGVGVRAVHETEVDLRRCHAWSGYGGVAGDSGAADDSAGACRFRGTGGPTCRGAGRLAG